MKKEIQRDKMNQDTEFIFRIIVPCDALDDNLLLIHPKNQIENFTVNNSPSHAEVQTCISARLFHA